MLAIYQYCAAYCWAIWLWISQALWLTAAFVDTWLSVGIVVLVWLLLSEGFNIYDRTSADPVRWKAMASIMLSRRLIPSLSSTGLAFLAIAAGAFAINLLRAPLLLWDQKLHEETERAADHAKDQQRVNDNKYYEPQITAAKATASNYEHLLEKLERPLFRLTFEEIKFMRCDCTSPHDQLVLVLVDVTNLGADSFVKGADLSIRSSQGNTFDTTMVFVVNKKLSTKLPDLLLEKVGNIAIHRENRQPGWLTFQVRDATQAQLSAAGTVWTVYVWDYLNQKYAASYTIPPHFSSQDIYVPGIQALPTKIR